MRQPIRPSNQVTRFLGPNPTTILPRPEPNNISNFHPTSNDVSNHINLYIPSKCQYVTLLPCRIHIPTTLRNRSLTSDFPQTENSPTKAFAQSRSSPKHKSRTARSRNGSGCGRATPSGTPSIPVWLFLHRCSLLPPSCGLVYCSGASVRDSTRGVFISSLCAEMECGTYSCACAGCRYNAKRRHWRKTRIGI